MEHFPATLGNGQTIVPLTLFFEAKGFYERFPLLVQAQKWGEEICFQVPDFSPSGDKTSIVAVGDIAFEPDCGCVSLFFGSTPVSTDKRIRSSSQVIIIGKIDDDSFEKIGLFKDGEVLKFLA